jgi:hypothetical protein
MDQAVTLEHHRPVQEILGGSLTEGIGGAGAIVLAILGLIGILPAPLASIAVIAIGLSLLVGGGAVAAQYSRLLAKAEPRFAAELIGGGMTMEALCGLAGVVLGILALLHLEESTLLAVALLIFGGALLMGSIATARLNDLRKRLTANSDNAYELASEALYAASGSEVLIGAAASVLGILALSGFDPLTLTLVGLLCVGASVLFNGMSVGGSMLSIHHADAR